jgi:PilZ domain
MNERRADQRRAAPTGRSALLRVDGRDHIVSLVDLSRSGAQLGTRLEVGAGSELVLRLLLPAGRGESQLHCEVVRRIPRDESTGRPAGLAVRFKDLAPDQVTQLEAFVAAGSFASEG